MFSEDLSEAALKSAMMLNTLQYVDFVYYSRIRLEGRPTIVFSDIRNEGLRKWNDIELDSLLADNPKQYDQIVRKLYSPRRNCPRLVVVATPLINLRERMPNTFREYEFTLTKGYKVIDGEFVRACPAKKVRLHGVQERKQKHSLLMLEH